MNAPLVERAALAAAAVVLVLAVVFLATGGPSKTGADNALASATPTPVASAPSGISTPEPTAAKTAAPSAAPVRTVQPATTTRPSGPKPPTEGKYLYTETDSSGTHTSTVEITDQGGGRQVENEDNGGVVNEVAWKATGKYETATTFGGSSGSFRCLWNPTYADYVFPLRTGTKWRIDSSCHPNASSSVTISGSAQVTGSDERSVGGTSVKSSIVITDATVTFAGNGQSFTLKIHDEDHFAPDYGLSVHEVTTTTGSAQPGTQPPDKTTRDLQNLTPGTQA